MKLQHIEQSDGVVIKHTRNRREYSLPELYHFSVDGYCIETNIFYEFSGVIGKAVTVILFVTSSPQMETH